MWRSNTPPRDTRKDSAPNIFLVLAVPIVSTRFGYLFSSLALWCILFRIEHDSAWSITFLQFMRIMQSKYRGRWLMPAENVC